MLEIHDVEQEAGDVVYNASGEHLAFKKKSGYSAQQYKDGLRCPLLRCF
jgi:hypothetical protein